jgi:hypothetical protein
VRLAPAVHGYSRLFLTFTGQSPDATETATLSSERSPVIQRGGLTHAAIDLDEENTR